GPRFCCPRLSIAVVIANSIRAQAVITARPLLCFTTGTPYTVARYQLVRDLTKKRRRAEVFASSDRWPWCHRQARFQKSTLVRTADAVGTRILHIRAPVAR